MGGAADGGGVGHAAVGAGGQEPSAGVQLRQHGGDARQHIRHHLRFDAQKDILRLRRHTGVIAYRAAAQLFRQAGKSFFAGCIANALLDKGIPVLMTNFSRILNTLTGMYTDDRNQFIDSFNKYSLLIIDDLGIERSSEFALEQVFNVIDSRYRSKKPLIVTTNLTLDELKHPKDLARARIYDRVLERCVPLKINNQNIRELNAAANMQEARKILNSGT